MHADTPADRVPPARSRSDHERILTATAQLLRWSSREVREVLRAGVEVDLSETDVWVLGMIDEAGSIRATSLARWQGIDKSSVALQVRRLERHGLLRRGEDASDGRAVLLSLSDRGHAVREHYLASGSAVLDELMGGWPAKDRKTLATLLDRLAQHLPGPVPR